MGDVIKFPKEPVQRATEERIKPTNFDTVPPVIAMLEETLERAKRGEVIFAALAIVGSDGIANSTWEPANTGQVMTTLALGSVNFLASRYNESVVAGSTHDEPEPPEQA